MEQKFVNHLFKILSKVNSVWINSKLYFLLLGFLSTAWITCRVITKPSRAAHQDMGLPRPSGGITRSGYGHYSIQVDLMGYNMLGENTLLKLFITGS